MDAVNAVALVRMLSSLASARSKAIVMTIDQPRSLVFRQFDKVLMLAEGRTVFFGAPADSVRYMDEQRMICPPAYTETDFWVETLAMPVTDESDAEEESDTDCRPETDSDSDGGTAEQDKTLETIDSSVTEVEAGQSKRKRQQKRRSQRGGSSTFSPLMKLIQLWDDDALAKQMELESRRPACLNGFAKVDPKPKSTNPVVNMFDEFMRVCIQKGDQDNNEESKRKSVTQHDHEEDFAVRDGPKYSEYCTSWMMQYSVLTQRAFKASRTAIFAKINLIKSIVIGLLVGVAYFQLGYTEGTLFDMRSYIYFTTSYWTLVAMFEGLFSFHSERQVLFKVCRGKGSVFSCIQPHISQIPPSRRFNLSGVF